MSVSTASNGAINIYLTGGALDRAEKMLAGIPGGTEKAVKSAMSRAVSNMRSGYVKEVQKKYDIPENGMQYAETVQAEDAYPASAAQPAAEAAAFAPAEADKVDIPLDGQTPENGLSAAEMNHAAEADAMLADYTAVISPRAVDAMGSFAAQNAKPAAEAVQAESAKSSTTTQLQPMSLSPVFQISGMQDSQQLRSALNQIPALTNWMKHCWTYWPTISRWTGTAMTTRWKRSGHC